MKDINIFQEERPWGNFRQFTKDANSTVKIITINKGESLSLQSHTKRSEFWKVLSGSGMIEIDDIKYEVVAGDEHIVPVSTKHRISAGVSGIEVLEIAVGEFDEEDIVRYEDKYGRV